MILVTDASGRRNRQQCFVDGVVGTVAAFRLTSAVSNVHLLRPATVFRSQFKDPRLEQAFENFAIVVALLGLEIWQSTLEDLDNNGVSPPERG